MLCASTNVNLARFSICTAAYPQDVLMATQQYFV
nr:MAG TPA: hypothetical protein [Caudoviricetes sp.]